MSLKQRLSLGEMLPIDWAAANSSSLPLCVLNAETSELDATLPFALGSSIQAIRRGASHFHILIDETRCRTKRNPARAPFSGSTSSVQADNECFTCLHGLAISFNSFNESFHHVAPHCLRFHLNTCKIPAMPKLTETLAAKLAHPSSSTRKYWDTEVKGFGLFVGKRSKTSYFQRD
ncbi:MAG: hypothetical protein R3268_12680, partial [Acidiferrobacterales bacterium]|nr:hypothetical protein [Acidiferrobacterales bacterium]